MSSFPLTFTTGIQQWTNFKISCGSCNQEVPDELTRGHVDCNVVGDAQRITQSTSYSVIAYSLCPQCNKLSTTYYLLHEDMTLTKFDPRTGEYVRQKMRKTPKVEELPKVERFRDKIKAFFVTVKGKLCA